MLLFIYCDFVGFCFIVVVVVMKGLVVVYGVVFFVYDDVFFVVNFKKNEKSIISYCNVFLCR